MNVSVVIPNLNGEKYLDKCIKSILAQTTKCSLIIVDNASADKSTEIINKYKEITLLPQKTNTGFTKGVNIGIKYAINQKADYIALFNNDAIADKNWLKNLLEIARADKKIGIVTCKFLRVNKKTIDSTGDFYTIYGLPFPRGRNELDNKQYDGQTNVFSGSGGASLFNVKMLKEIGLFDEDFFAYFEDTDIGFRAQLAGWKAKYQPKAVAYHRVGATASKISGFAAYQTAKNIPILYLKNMPGWLFFKYLPFFIYWYTRMVASHLIKGNILAFAKGLFMSVFYAPKKIIERYKIQKSRKVSIKYIDSILIHSRPPRPPKL